MKKYMLLFVLFLFFAMSFNTSAQINELIKGAKDKLTGNKPGSGEMSDDKVASGLKEALTIGSKNAVEIVSQVDGYFKNDLIKIPLPQELKSIESAARNFGLGEYFDELILSMNRSAESAAKSATPILIDAITGITITDAMTILKGREDEATLYFRDRTENKLSESFKPIVSSAMGQVGVTKTYNDLASNIKKIPFLKLNLTNLEDYVTAKALDGLFTMVAVEEKKIRENPAARITDLLKDVFGGIGKP